MMTQRGSIRGELIEAFGADADGSPSNLADPLPPYEEMSNRIYYLLSRACHLSPGASKTHEDSQTVYELLPLLLLRILGYRAGSGWLETGSELTHRDREALLKLILPHGPIHSFCLLCEESKTNSSADFMYEFPVSNLPYVTRSALDDSSQSSEKLENTSALAPLVISALRDGDSNVLVLTPIQYLELCLVSSAAQKKTDVRPANAPKQKRSSSLPSVRSMYNKVIAAYAESIPSNERLGSTRSLLIPAFIDLLCLPWNGVVSQSSTPRPSTQSIDAISSVLLALRPKTESEAKEAVPPKSTSSWSELTNAESVHVAVGQLLLCVFQRYSTKDPTSVFAGYVRLFALFLAPWKRSIRTAMAAGLFPKKRSKPPTGGPSIKSTLTSINEQFGYPGWGDSQATELGGDVMRKWIERLMGDRSRQILELLELCVIRSANQRLAGSVDGVRALCLVTDAIVGSGNEHHKGQYKLTGPRLDEVKGCLDAIRDQSIEVDKRMNVVGRTKTFTNVFATALGVHIEGGGGLLTKITGARSPARSSTTTARFVHQRKTELMRQALHDRVEFLGSDWDRPITSNENEQLVIMLYWIALRIEPTLGFVPNIRFLGKKWVCFMVGTVLTTTILVLFLMHALN